MEVRHIPLAELSPMEGNPREISDDGLDRLKRSLMQHGLFRPLLGWEDPETGTVTVIGGNQRLRAISELADAGKQPTGLDLSAVPVVLYEGSWAQARAVAVRDNTYDGDWDLDSLQTWLTSVETDLQDLIQADTFQGLDALFGFADDEFATMFSDLTGGTGGTGGGTGGDGGDGPALYTHKIETPIYEPTRAAPPELDELVDRDEVDERLANIEEAVAREGIPEPVAEFLRTAATRFYRFDFQNIAEYYAHAPAEIQRLMEDSVLVIIDFDQAVERGFVQLDKRLGELADLEAKRAASED